MESRPHAGNEAENNNVFKRFDVVSDYSDHSFVNSTPKCHKPHKAIMQDWKFFKAYKAIMQEWKFLEEHLPESIFVRAYEDRIDLLRAVIVGAAGTPYYNGLFFFDFLFPSDYPSLPPKVHYRSYGLSMNPNLYPNGHVCLSLLNTWIGKECEKWNPSNSSVFQILLSIQALILNEKPYFNEPSPASASLSAPVLHKKSQDYTEEVFALSCRTMLYLNSSPPKNFEVFISRHFRRQGSSILMACEAYMKGQVPVGYFGESPSIIKVSAKFRAEMKQLYPKLVDAFRRNGASTDTSIERLTETQSPKPSVAGKKKDGIVKKVITKIRKMLGFKKKTTGQIIKATGSEG